MKVPAIFNLGTHQRSRKTLEEQVKKYEQRKNAIIPQPSEYYHCWSTDDNSIAPEYSFKYSDIDGDYDHWTISIGDLIVKRYTDAFIVTDYYEIYQIVALNDLPTIGQVATCRLLAIGEEPEDENEE